MCWNPYNNSYSVLDKHILKQTHLAQIATLKLAKLGPDNNSTTYIHIQIHIHIHIYIYTGECLRFSPYLRPPIDVTYIYIYTHRYCRRWNWGHAVGSKKLKSMPPSNSQACLLYKSTSGKWVFVEDFCSRAFFEAEMDGVSPVFCGREVDSISEGQLDSISASSNGHFPKSLWVKNPSKSYFYSALAQTVLKQAL